jgi:hypothetical protein
MRNEIGLYRQILANVNSIQFLTFTVFKHLVSFIYTLFSLQCNSSLTIKNSSLLLHDMFRPQRATIRCFVC